MHIHIPSSIILLRLSASFLGYSAYAWYGIDTIHSTHAYCSITCMPQPIYTVLSSHFCDYLNYKASRFVTIEVENQS